ncbi:hypothetical protein MesoLjLc_34780 [Mesorhizobium sp. L-8-10]|uniref:hypothetical protein n=1 Tax=Mesorhizobium sp. L-8-10 TaxID=2744523 RepID=UPI00192544F0|nr:hypothetical protein [Mesorhizobium sp. L-8-10]BCH31548.1 hypothetical protein MesoLjLc_34780 [Mesorhizobium sp. L-8-10]
MAFIDKDGGARGSGKALSTESIVAEQIVVEPHAGTAASWFIPTAERLAKLRGHSIMPIDAMPEIGEPSCASYREAGDVAVWVLRRSRHKRQ